METRDLNTSCRQYEEMDVSPQERHRADSNIEASNNVVNESTTDQKEGKCENDLGKSNVVVENKGDDDGKLKPEVGMEFETVEDAYNFYNQFGSFRGFSIRKHNSTKDKKTGVVKMRKFVCSNEGHRGPDRRNSSVKHHRDETRTGCLCYMMIILGENGKYRVSNFLDDHNHPLVSPDKIHMLRSQRKLSLSQDPVSDDCNKSGVRQKFSKQAEGQINVGFPSANYRSHLQAKRMKAMEIIDAGDLLEYFKRKQVEDPMFFHSIQVDADDCITNVFWADGRMLMDYEHFGDVVCLDTTYRKTGYGRPLALFIGINNHKQIVIFGAALLYDETAESFGWLFSTFCESMSGKKPLTIFTDQDNAISTVIEEDLPGTTHRICVWHVFQNAVEQLNHVFQGSQSFDKDFSKCIYDYEEEEDFLAAWGDMLGQYSLRDNTWLTELFEEKEKWALVYGKSAFSADMKNSLRNESMNKELKTYLDPKNRITDFFYYFERLLDDRRNAEFEANFRMPQSTSSCIGVPVDILKHAANVYTSTIFKMIETEYVNGLDWQVEETSDVGTLKKYNIFDGKGHKHIVTFNPIDESITCSCKKFESVGILCGHSLKATMHKLQHIPEKYILKRWTREATAYSLKPSSDGCKPREHKKDLCGRYSALLCSFIRIAAKAAESRETFECVAKFTELMLGDIEKMSRLHGLKDSLKGVECLGDKVVNEGNNAELMADNAPLEDMSGNKRKENCHDGHKMDTCLEKGSHKRRRKKLSQMMNAISSNKCSTPAHNHASNHPPNFLSHATYGMGMNPAHYHAPTHPPTLIPHGLFGSGMMPIYYNDQYHPSTHPHSLISQENLPVNYFQEFQQRSSEDR